MTRFLSALAVLVVAVIAAVISFGHIETVALGYGQTLLAARLLPVSVDGALVAASMVLLDAARRGVPAPALARIMLGLGVAATLGANAVSGAGHGPIGVVVAMLPAVFFIGSVEVLLSMIRVRTKAAPVAVPEVTHESAPEAVAEIPPSRTRQAAPGAPRPLSPRRTRAHGVHRTPEIVFAAELEAGTVPGIRTVKSRMRVGQYKAAVIRDQLAAAVAARPSGPIETIA